jgi:hypothetical protein
MPIPELRASISNALEYLAENSIAIPTDLLIQARLKGIHALKAGDYSAIRNQFYNAVERTVSAFLNSNGQPGTSARSMSTALSLAYIDTADTAYVDGGGSLPLDEDTAAWARGQLDAQFGYVDSLFQTLKTLRKDGDFDASTEAERRAILWASALDGFYNAVKMLGAGNKMLTWHLGNTEKHCATCSKLDGGRHRASWYTARGYTPRKPGSNTDCGGYNCDCSLTDDEGNDFTI